MKRAGTELDIDAGANGYRLQRFIANFHAATAIYRGEPRAMRLRECFEKRGPFGGRNFTHSHAISRRTRRASNRSLLIDMRDSMSQFSLDEVRWGADMLGDW